MERKKTMADTTNNSKKHDLVVAIPVLCQCAGIPFRIDILSHGPHIALRYNRYFVQDTLN